MALRFLLVVLLLFGVSMTAAAQAPFCVVTTYTRDCGSYYDSQSCREQAAAAGGICVVNQDAQPAQLAPANRGQQGIDFGAVTRGQRQAQEDIRAQQQERRAAEEHVARMRMLQAQQQAAQGAAAQAAQAQAPVYSSPQPAAVQTTDFITQRPAGSKFGEARVLHSSCLAAIQRLQVEGAPEGTLSFGSYCWGTVRAVLFGHRLRDAQGAAKTFCVGDAFISEVVKKLVRVPPGDPTGDDLDYVRGRLIADWPC